MTCKRCATFLQHHPLIDGHHELSSGIRMGPIQCAFPDGKTFSSDNWNCETMTTLRVLSGEDGHEWDGMTLFHAHYRWDDNADSIGVLAIPDLRDNDAQSGYLVMTWHKSHGKTGQAWVMWDGKKPRRLTLATAEAILDEQEKERTHQ